MRYLVVFAFVLAVANPKSFGLQLNLHYFYALLCVALSALVVFYGYQYIYYNVFHQYLSEKLSITSPMHREYIQSRQTLEHEIKRLPNVFGFSDYKERFIFVSLPLDDNQLAQRLVLGHRVLANLITANALVKQATWYAFAGDQPKAIKLFEGACFLNEYESCAMTVDYLRQVSQQEARFVPIYQAFNTWYQQNPDAQAKVKQQLQAAEKQPQQPSPQQTTQ